MKNKPVFSAYSRLVLFWVITLSIAQTVLAAKLSSIQVQSPSKSKLLAGQTLQLTATGTYSDGTAADITSKVTWAISNASVAKISASGVVSVVESAGGPGMPGMPGGNRQGNRQPGGPPPSGMPDGAGGPPPGDGMGGPGMPPPDGNFDGPDGPPPGNDDVSATTGATSKASAKQSNRQQRPDGAGGPSGGMPGGPGGMGMGGPGGGMPADSVISITATLDGVTSPVLSLTVTDIEGPAVYLQSGSKISKSNQTITTSDKSTSGVKVTDKGVFTLSNSTVTTSGNTTGMENSSFYGLNAGVLAMSGSKITMTGGAISTTGNGANGAFAVGPGSVVELSKVKIDCVATGAHGVDATIAGTIICTDVDIKTAGNGAAAAISTDRGGGTVTFTRGSTFTSGTRSPSIYSTGNITVTDARLESTGSEAIVIEGKNTVTLNNTTLSCLKQCGVMLYQSFSGDAGIGTSVLTMTGGSLTAADGPMFRVTNTNAIVNLKGDAKLNAKSGELISAFSGQWGNAGSNGGHLTFKADGETLAGNILCDAISSVDITFVNKTTLKGAINADNTAKTIAINLDTTSVWDVTGTSYLTRLTNSDTTLANIHSNGCTIYYQMKDGANKWLGGKTYPLPGGGKLVGR